MASEFVLPSLGENVASGDVVRVLIKEGDTVAPDQSVVELETDKATIEVPSSVAGTVTSVLVKPGDKLSVGQPVFAFDAADGGVSQNKEPARAAATAQEPDEAPASNAATGALVAEQAEEQAEERLAVATAPDEDEERAPAGQAPAPEAAAPAGPVEFVLPSLGENVSGGDVVGVLVNVGDTVACDQPLLELETDKATIEVPSTLEGRVLEVRVKEGQQINVGDVAFLIEVTGKAPARKAGPTVSRVHAAAAPPSSAPPAASPAPDDVAPHGGLQQSVPGKVRRPETDKPGMVEDALLEQAADRAPRPRAEVVSFRGESEGARLAAPASPSVRRVARELGVNINQVQGSGPGGRISADDVKAYVKRVMSAGGPRGLAPAVSPASAQPLPDFSKWGQVERTPMSNVRRKTAEHLSQAWTEIPHVTQFENADITALEELRQKFGKRAEAAGGKLTVTAVALKVVAAAIKQFPQFASSVDMSTHEIVIKKYVHVGVAVDTDRGLLVPVIRDVDRKNIVELSVELAQASERARTKKTSLEEMHGGVFTITNLGGIGGTAFTPIVNRPEVAILGLSRSRMEPVYIDGGFQPRLMLPMSLSYDHRVIDGADAMRFLRFVADALEQPFLLSLMG